MNIFDFKNRFGQTINEKEIKTAFVNHLNYKLFEPLDREIGYYYIPPSERQSGSLRGNISVRDGGSEIFDAICLYLNKNPTQIVKDYNSSRGIYTNEIFTPPLSFITNNDFERSLIVVEAAYEYFQTSGYYKSTEWCKLIDSVISEQIESPLSLGISWVCGKFIPQGAKELQEALIKDNLVWLSDYPKTQKLFQAALNDYAASRGDEIKRKNAMSNSFQAVEQFARIFLNTDKSFDNIFGSVVENLHLNSYWKNICNSWNELAKEFARHSGRTQIIPSQEDTEAFIYLSGLLLRLMIQRQKINHV